MDLNPQASLVTGVTYGVHIENVNDELIATIRRLDKLAAGVAGKSLTASLMRAEQEWTTSKPFTTHAHVCSESTSTHNFDHVG